MQYLAVLSFEIYKNILAQKLIIFQYLVSFLIIRLGLNNNRLTSLPNEVINLTALRYLNLKSNALKEFPAIVSESEEAIGFLSAFEN